MIYNEDIELQCGILEIEYEVTDPVYQSLSVKLDWKEFNCDEYHIDDSNNVILYCGPNVYKVEYKKLRVTTIQEIINAWNRNDEIEMDEYPEFL